MSSIISTVEEFQNIQKSTPNFFLLKHSLTCPISAEGKEQYNSFSETTNVPTYILHVQEARPLSNYISETFQVKHESPQVLLFHNSEVAWNTSHWDITVSHLAKALASLEENQQ
ncbi:bacillithiol system redox-active protein YtxJ [Bacillaceae bacterium S4-13-58]